MTSLTGVNTTSTLSSGQQELGEQGHGQPGGGVQGKQQSEAQENSPMWKGMPQPQFPARGIHTVQYVNIYTKPSYSRLCTLPPLIYKQELLQTLTWKQNHECIDLPKVATLQQLDALCVH